MSEASFRLIGLPTMVRRIKMVSIGIACVVFASLSTVAAAYNATGKTQFRRSAHPATVQTAPDLLSVSEFMSLI
jgi:hypothetical protein